MGIGGVGCGFFVVGCFFGVVGFLGGGGVEVKGYFFGCVGVYVYVCYWVDWVVV